jgi:hypothetical protein
MVEISVEFHTEVVEEERLNATQCSKVVGILERKSKQEKA